MSLWLLALVILGTTVVLVSGYTSLSRAGEAGTVPLLYAPEDQAKDPLLQVAGD
jgi:hypothetical protein